jgi:hypothetical protein
MKAIKNMKANKENNQKIFKFTDKKRRRSSSYTIKEIEESEKPSKKFNSTETKKMSELNMKEINYFIAKIDPHYENKEFPEEEKLIGQKLIFDYRRKKAENLINNIKEDNDELNHILEALKYDNTNKVCIYKLLNYYYKKKEKKNFDEALNKYKFCITQKFMIKENEKEILIDLNKMYEIKTSIEELEELPNHKQNEGNKINDLRNSMVEFFTSYYYITKCIDKFRDALSKEELEKILSVKYIKSSNDDSYKFDYEINEKLNLLAKNKIENKNKKLAKNEKDENKTNKKNKEIEEEEKKENLEIEEEELEEKVSGELLLKSIENFLSKYMFYQEFKLFQMNQPVDYNNNLSLYYNYFIWSLYEITLEVNETEQKIVFREQKIVHYSKLTSFHNLLFDEYFDKKEPLQEILNQLLHYLIMALSKERDGHLHLFYELIHLNKKEKFLDENSAKLFKNKLNQSYNFVKADFVKGNKDQIELKGKNKMECKSIKIKWKDYTREELISSKLPKNIHWIWENINFTKFQETNFFLKEDLEYLHFLIKHILSSELFKTIFDHFNNVSSKADFYFGNNDNINDYIRRIIFLPFSVNDLEKFAQTDRRTLSILVSGFPEKLIYDLNEYRFYRILELALRTIVLGCHEPCHYIKSAYSLLTENIISRNTSNTDKDIESGFFCEEIFFGWDNTKNSPLNLVEMGLLKEEIECQNQAIKNKQIDLITAIKLLDPEIYSKDLDYFRKSIFNLSPKNLETFSFSSIKNQRYKSYLNQVLDVEKIKESRYSNYTINVAMGSGNATSVHYIRFNHNLERKV